ncbi:MAG: YfhO family protein [Anaerolineae bacterium]|nr:YfhO family protein [Anaerolineae bacterium]
MQGARSKHWSLLIVNCSFILFPLLLLWRPLFAGEAFHWGTPLLQFVPWQRMAAGMWRGGHLPLWNPLVGCGAPLAANYQTAAFYPLNALYLLLPAEVALTWTTGLHLALAGWGRYRWGRAVGLGRFAALIGALALEGSGFLVARVALFPSMAFAFPWIGVWLWRGEMLLQRGRLSDSLWLGLVLGLGLLAGHAQTAFYGGVLLAAYLLFRTVQIARRETRDWRWLLGHCSLFIAPLFVGLGLAAIQLLPTAELMLQSQRATGVDYDFAMTNSMWPWRLITFLAPDFFGNPGRGTYWGFGTYWEDAGYVGLLPLLLAAGMASGVVFRRGWSAKRECDEAGLVAFWAIGAIVALVLALGQNTPIFPFLFRYVPTFDLFQAPARWLSVTTVALAALTALAAQRWPAGRLRQRRGALGIVFGGAFLIAGLAAPFLIAGERLATFGAATLRLGVTLVGMGLLILFWREKPLWRAAVVGFVFLDLLFFGWPLVPTVDRALYQGSTQAAAFLGESAGARIYWPTDPTHRNREYDAENRIKFEYLDFSDFGPRDMEHWWAMRELLISNAGVLDGVASANNFDPLLVGRYADLLSVARTSRALRLMGVTHVMSDEAWPDAEPVYTTDSVALYRLPDALGRAWIVPNGRRVLSDRMPALLSGPGFDPTFEVLLEQKSLSENHSPILPLSHSQILSLQDGPNRVTIRAALGAPGYLVLADTWYPGWRATVDGEPAEILRANYAFRAVWLEAGEHTVEMAYRPTSALVGGALSIATLVVIVIGLLLARRREAGE